MDLNNLDSGHEEDKTRVNIHVFNHDVNIDDPKVCLGQQFVIKEILKKVIL